MLGLPKSEDESFSSTTALRSRSPLKFILWVFALSLPFWLAGALTTVQLLPGVPVSALMFFCTAAAALLFVYRESKWAGVTELLKRSFDVQRAKAKIWFVPTIFLAPCIGVLTYVAMRLMGVPLPIPQFSVITTLALLVAFFISALGEELGWSGYVIDPLQGRFGALRGALLLGVVWAVWHWVPLLEVPRSLSYIAWWSLGTVAARVIIVWLYNSTGKSVFVAALFHTMMNVTWQLFPVNGSFYDPRVTGPITAVAAVMVVIVWGPRLTSGGSTFLVKRRGLRTAYGVH